MLRVKGTFSALVNYVGPTKGKKTLDGLLYTVQDNVNPVTVREVLIQEELLWLMSDNVTEAVFINVLPKAVKITQIF